MNKEQILECAEQSRLYAKSIIPNSVDDPIRWTYEYHKKFAELIAKQCIEICKIERSNVNTRRRQAQDEIEYIKCIEAGSTCDIINMEIWKAFIK